MSGNQCKCHCRHRVIIASQVLSIVAFCTGIFPAIISLTGVLHGGGSFHLAAVVAPLIVFVLHQLLWCLDVPMSIHWPLGFASLILAVSNIGSGVYWYYHTISSGWNKIFYPTLWIISGVFWIIVAILNFVYWWNEEKEEIKDNIMIVDVDNEIEDEDEKEEKEKEEVVLEDHELV